MVKVKVSGTIDGDVLRVAQIEARQRGFKTFSSWLEWAMRGAIDHPERVHALKADYHQRMADAHKSRFVQIVDNNEDELARIEEKVSRR